MCVFSCFVFCIAALGCKQERGDGHFIRVVWTDRPDKVLNTAARRYSGLGQLRTVPPLEVRRFLINQSKTMERFHLGRSAFGYSRAIKQIVRVGLSWLEVDLCNAHFNLLAPGVENIVQWARYMAETAAVRAEVCKAFKAVGALLAGDDIKEVILSIANAGGLSKWCRDRGIHTLPKHKFLDGLARDTKIGRAHV